MKLVFLGTASCFPTPARGVSCIALQWKQTGEVWIFDCGEGSQIQMQKSCLKYGKVSKIFITHLHGDHVFGLPGFLCTLGNGADEDKVVDLYGPLGLKKLLVTSLELSQSPLPYKVRVHEMVPKPEQFAHENSADLKRYRCPETDFPWRVGGGEADEEIEFDPAAGGWSLIGEKPSVVAGPIKHRIPSFAFVVHERTTPGSLDAKKLKELGVAPSQKYTKLKNGEDVMSDDGSTLIRSADVVGPTKRGRKVAVLGDTCDTAEIESLCAGCHAVVHEATMENELREKAVEYGHSTPEMAAAFAVKVGAGKLILTHLSPRYKPVSVEVTDKNDKSAAVILEEARSYLQSVGSDCQVEVAEDFYEIEL